MALGTASDRTAIAPGPSRMAFKSWRWGYGGNSIQSWIPAFAGMTERHRIPGNIPFMPRIIFCIPPLENCFIIFCVCSN